MTHLGAIRSICEGTDLSVEVGGGVRSTETIDALLDAGVTRVILGTAALQQWEWFEGLMADYPGKVVLGLDACKGTSPVAGWAQITETTAV